MLHRLKVWQLLLIIFVVLSAAFAAVWWGNLWRPFPSEPVTLRVWTVSEDAPAFKALTDQYARKHPNVTFQIEPQDPAGYSSALGAARSAASSPDLYVFHTDQLTHELPFLAPAPSRTVTSSSVTHAFAPAVAQADLRGGQVYGLPLSLTNLALLYRPSRLSAAGVTTPPKTWSELLTDLPKLTQKTGAHIDRSAIALGTPLTDPATITLQVLMEQNGARMVGADGHTLNFTAPEAGSDYLPAAKALDFFTAFASPNKQSFTWADSLGAPETSFASGATAMLITTPDRAVALRAQLGADFGVATLPGIQATSSLNQADFYAYGISRASRNIFVAWDFLRYATSSGPLGAYLKTADRLSPRLDLGQTQAKDPTLAPFAAQLSLSRTWPLADYPETITALRTAMTDTLSGKSTSQQALEQARASLQPLLKWRY